MRTGLICYYKISKMASVPPPDYNPASLLPNVAADITTIRGGGFSLDFIGGEAMNTSTVINFSPGLNTSTMVTVGPENKTITVSKEPYTPTDPRKPPVRTKPVPGEEEAMLITGDKAKIASLGEEIIKGLRNESVNPNCQTDRGVILNSRCAAHSVAAAAALGRIVKDDIKKENEKTNYYEELKVKPSDFKPTTSRKIVDMRYDTDKKQLFLDYEDDGKYYRFYGRNVESLLEVLNNKFSAKANTGVGDKPKNTNTTLTVTPPPPPLPPQPPPTEPQPPQPPPTESNQPTNKLIKLQSDLISKYKELIVKRDEILEKKPLVISKKLQDELNKLEELINNIEKVINTIIADKKNNTGGPSPIKNEIEKQTVIIAKLKEIIEKQKESIKKPEINKLKGELIILKRELSVLELRKPKGGKRNSTQKKRRGSKIDL